MLTRGSWRWRSLSVSTVLLSLAAVVTSAGLASAATDRAPEATDLASVATDRTATAAADKATVFIIQGVDATAMDIGLDGDQVRAAAAAKTIIGPLTLAPGRHALTAEPSDGGPTVAATVTLAAGSSTDVVLHRQADVTRAPVFTTYVNDLTPVTAGSGRLAVAHTAAVGPADIRVKGKVLFANVANGEQLTLTVPGGTYPVDIVPTASTAPVVFGPVDLQVADASLTRVFAIGVAATKSMDAVVQVLPVATRGSGESVSRVDAGDGGQAQGLIAAHRLSVPAPDGPDRLGAAPLPHSTTAGSALTSGTATWTVLVAAAALAALVLAAGHRLRPERAKVSVRAQVPRSGSASHRRTR